MVGRQERRSWDEPHESIPCYAGPTETFAGETSAAKKTADDQTPI
jgi:hypothetical protein